MRYAVAGLLVGVSMLRAANGAACSEPYYTYEIGSFGPDSGQVELNAPLLLTTIENDGEWDPDRSAELDPSMELRVLGSDAPLEVLRPIHFGSTLSFVPTKELAPNTTYSVSARLVADLAIAVEGEKVSWQFTTGTALREPLQLEGEWQVTFEQGRDEQFQCTNDFAACGSDCEPIGDVAVTKARITTPRVHGGFAKEYLSATLAILPDDPAVDGALVVTGLEIEEGTPGELLVTMPLLEGSSYKPCFQFEATDGRNARSMSVYCVDQAFPVPAGDPGTDEPQPEPKPEPKPEPQPMNPPQVTDEVVPEVVPGNELAAEHDGAPRRTSSGCSTSGGSPGLGSALGLLLGLLAFSRRRQPRTAP